VRDIFCAVDPPRIRSLLDLQLQLGLFIDESELSPIDQPPVVSLLEDSPEQALVMLNSSTALSGRTVSTINPRAILIGETATLAFNRGVQQVELLSRDRNERNLNFYLLRFEQACNTKPQGCSPGDLYTPRVESDWTNVRVDEDEDIKNTPSDCRQCHQRGREHAIMLMRELDGPWTHFFSCGDEAGQSEDIPEANGVDVLRAYFLAKGDEPYGNIPSAAIRTTFGFTLQITVNLPQPLEFDSNAILNERWPWHPERGYATEPLPSKTWYGQYAAFKRGENLAPPYFDSFPSDAGKLAHLTDVYSAFRAGEIHADELPDLADIYSDDQQTRAELGFQTEPDATPVEVLIQACGSCHNDVLDQTISRAAFNIDLARMDRAMLDRAIARIGLPLEATHHMPPREFRQLDPAGQQALIEYLGGETRAAEDDAMLQRAAQLGMAVESPTPRGSLEP